MREKRHLSPAKIQAVAEAAKRQLARTHYADYVEYVHHGRWKRARHLDLICAELEKVITGETKRLMIFMPPRHGKSMTVTATFPSYYLGKYPDRRVIEVSYGDDLAKEFGDANRMKIAEHGCELFGVLLSQTAASKVSWNLEGHSGGMISVGVGGGITGKGADLLILDDPIKNRQEAESETYRKNLLDEWRSSIYTRLHPGASVIIILTRWHEADLAASLLESEAGDWKVLSLPCVCDDENDLLGRNTALTTNGANRQNVPSALTHGQACTSSTRPQSKAESSSAAGSSSTTFCLTKFLRLSSLGTAPSKKAKPATMLPVMCGCVLARIIIW